MLPRIINKLDKRQNLSRAELAFFVNADLTIAQQKQFLLKFEAKGARPAEAAGLAKLLLRCADLSIICPQAVDICGTGGSGLPRLNTSTLAAFVLSAAGVPVAKHGNKAASGRFGSFDLLAGLGFNIEPTVERMSFAFYKERLLFMYARQFYPIMKKFASARSELGQPSIFNILGPLLSPANPGAQLIGVADRSKMELMASAAKLLGRKKVLIVRGQDGLDEVTLAGRTEVVEAGSHGIKRYFISPADFGLSAADGVEILAGGSAKKNIALAKAILRGREVGPIRDLVLVNAALALKMVGRAGSYRQGYLLAKKTLQTGLAYKKLENYRRIINSQSALEEIVGHKYQEVAKTSFRIPAVSKKSKRNFLAALRKPGLSLIAEIKRASPAQGDLYRRKRFSAKAIAKLYEANGAAAISVVTDKRYFQGDGRYLTEAARASHLPVLCKDFIIDSRQIAAARGLGADAVLLIAAILDDNQLGAYLSAARKLGMDALVEVHSRLELERAMAAGARIIGINNRDLHTLKIDLNVTKNLLAYVPAGVIIVSESGITNALDAKNLPQRVDGILVGSGIMSSSTQAEMAGRVRQLARARKIFKACGIRSVAAARYCEKIGVAMVGLNFVPSSRRCLLLPSAKQIRKELKSTKAVGVFMDQPLSDVHKIAAALHLDYVQLSGGESRSYARRCRYPIIKTIALRRAGDAALARQYRQEKNTALIIFDSQSPGSGQEANYGFLAGVKFPFLIAGGVRLEKIKNLDRKIRPLGFDVAGGLEDTHGRVSLNKIKDLQAAITKTLY